VREAKGQYCTRLAPGFREVNTAIGNNGPVVIFLESTPGKLREPFGSCDWHTQSGSPLPSDLGVIIIAVELL